MTVLVDTILPPVVAVYHPLNVYPARVGLVGRVPTADPDRIDLVVGVCHAHPLPENVTEWLTQAGHGRLQLLTVPPIHTHPSHCQFAIVPQAHGKYHTTVPAVHIHGVTILHCGVTGHIRLHPS